MERRALTGVDMEQSQPCNESSWTGGIISRNKVRLAEASRIHWRATTILPNGSLHQHAPYKTWTPCLKSRKLQTLYGLLGIVTTNASLTPPITLEALQEQLQQLQQSLSTVLTNQSVVNTKIQALKNGEATSSGGGSHTHNTQYERMTKIEFLKFKGEDVKGWVYRCKHFFKIDGIEEDMKVELASMHLYDQALVWHQQYVKKYGDRTPWVMYEEEID
ncbi:hypothetical protein Tco_0711154 [Tanacetum coccineum]